MFVLALVIYYRRHRRRDLVLAYVALNVGLFAVVSMLTTTSVDMALGFGLFAILSIIRLRSDAITQEEVAYYFITLVMGLINGLRLDDLWMTIMLNAALLAVMYGVDHSRFLARTQRRKLTLDTVIEDPDDLVADLEGRVRGRVVHHVVDHVDYVLEITVVDVRFVADRTDRAAGAPRSGSATPRRARRLTGVSV